MKITINRLLLSIVLISLMFYGIVAEGITVLCLSASIVIERNRIKRVIEKKYYKACVLYVLAFLLLFILHIFLLNENSEEIVRLYGLTKNICFPALMVLAFGYTCTDDYSIRLVMIEMIIFNTIYAIAFLTRINFEVISFQLGSVNGCSGISIILLPAAVMYLKFLNSDSINNNRRFLIYTFIITTVLLTVVSDSSTSKILIALELIMYFISSLIQRVRIKQSLKGFIIPISLAAIGLSLLIATGKIALDPNELKTRVGIWTRAYNQFSASKGNGLLFGTGNDIVHMLSKDLEPHNMFLEILMIHGVIGLIVLTAFIVYTVKQLIRKDLKEFKPLLLSLAIYIVVCCLHPFFTGSTLFQFNCLIGLLFMLMLGKSKQLLIA